MKGLLHTSAFLKANFHKKCGLVAPGSLVNQVTLTEFPAQNRLVLLSDCAINVSPSYKEKVQIIQNAVALAYRLGIECPNVACLASVEVIIEKCKKPLMPLCLARPMNENRLKAAV